MGYKTILFKKEIKKLLNKNEKFKKIIYGFHQIYRKLLITGFKFLPFKLLNFKLEE